MMKELVTTEQLILDAAEKLFLDKGYAMTSTTEIAKVVGCNQALIHYYFRKKEILFLTLFEKKFIQFVTEINISELEGLCLEEKLRRIMDAHISMILKNPKLPFLIMTEFTTNPDRFEEVLKKIKIIALPLFMQIDKDIKRDIEDGKIRQIDPFQLLMSILSLDIFMFLSKPLFQKAAGLNEEDFLEFVELRKEEIFTLVWRGIRI